MVKSLKFIRNETERLLHSNGDVKLSLEKEFFDYICHTPDATCQLKPVVCRVYDKMKPSNEPVWSVEENVCKKCLATDNRLLEEIYRR